MPRETPSPIDLPDDPLDASGIGWTAAVIAIAALFLLATNATALRDWAEDLAPSPAQAQLAAMCEEWVTITDAVGLGAAHNWLHDRWKRIEGTRFTS